MPRAILTTSQHPILIEGVKRLAEEKGQNVSQYVGDVLAKKLTADERKKISEQKRYNRESVK